MRDRESGCEAMRIVLRVGVSAALLLPVAVWADEAGADGDVYFDVIQPLLKSKCVSCHGPEKQEANLRLDSLDAAKRGGDNGTALVPGDAAASLVMKAIRHDDSVSEMPPNEQLSDKAIAAISRWIDGGAVWPQAVMVLFDDERSFVQQLSGNDSSVRVEASDKASGEISVAVNSREGVAVESNIWSAVVREHPQAGEYRFLQFATKIAGDVEAIVEVANNGRWPEVGGAAGRYVVGRADSSSAAVRTSVRAADEWTVVTIDLWKDLGDSLLTGLSLASVDGQEVLFDTILLAADLESLSAYRPGRGQLVFQEDGTRSRIGDAWSDDQNPIARTFGGERLDLWSLRAPVRPALPDLQAREYVKTPVDHFVLAHLESQKLSLSSEADRRTLIRRLSFDVTGLPPAPEEVRAFIADDSEEAYEELVERLLASERYGQHWARHWLDVVRYADTNGYERDEFRTTMYRYRDYVIRAFNADKPYDQFLREQLAGDEMLVGLPQTDDEADMLIATGYLRLGGFDSTAPIFQEEKKFRNELMADLVNTTGSAMLGLTMSCCNCHDHKYDPLSQIDHFRMRAFFAAVKNQDDTIVDVANVRSEIDAHNAPIDRDIATAQNASAEVLEAARVRVADSIRATFPKKILMLLGTASDRQSQQVEEELKPWLEKLKVDDRAVAAALTESEKQRRKELQDAIARLRSQRRDYRRAITMADEGATAPVTHVFYQGDHTQPRNAVEAGFLSYADPNPAVITAPASGKSTGRRTALGDWVTSLKNPFTARVIVNRIWQHYFGVGIVATPNDFGYSGARPTHPQLLDWLATELVNNGWSLKHVHRTILRSATYRQASFLRDGPGQVDPDNRLLWRQNVRRVTAETLRDSMLMVAGRLLPIESGPPKWPHVSEEILHAEPAILEAAEGKDDGRRQGWYPDPEESTFVRSIFLVQKRSVPIPFLQPFDLPETAVSCARRDTTTVAPQALNLLNSPFSVQMSQALAERVANEAGDDDEARIRRVVWLTLSREPLAQELEVCRDLLKKHKRQHLQRPDMSIGAARTAALVDLCRALMNVNEFVYVD